MTRSRHCGRRRREVWRRGWRFPATHPAEVLLDGEVAHEACHLGGGEGAFQPLLSQQEHVLAREILAQGLDPTEAGVE